MKLASIIIPTFRRPDFITVAIESALAQTWPNVEVIVVDDNGLGTIDQQYNELTLTPWISSGKITYVPHEKNSNGATARNTGISVSHGEYIAFLDDDDWYSPTKLEKQIETMNNEGTTACLCGFQRLFGDYSKPGIPRKEELTEVPLLRFGVDTCAGSALIINRSLLDKLGGFDVSFRRHQDTEFLFRVLQWTKISVVPETLVQIRMHDDNTKIPKAEDILENRMHFLRVFDDDILALPPEDRSAIYNDHYFEIAKAFLKNHQFLSFLHWIFQMDKPLRGIWQIIISAIVWLRFKKSISRRQ